jgi:hypothetical protein
MVRTFVTMLIEVPESFTPEDITSQRNGSWCGDNIIDELIAGREAKKSCLCEVTQSRYLREATSEDDIEWGKETL